MFEKFRSKELTKTQSQEVVGGDYLQCLAACDMTCFMACRALGGTAWQSCLADCQWNCMIGCALAEFEV